MLRPVLLAAILSGTIAGGALSLVQSLWVIPLIHQAEVYEQAAAQQAPAADRESAPAKADPSEDGPARAIYTVLTNLLIGIAFGLLLTSAFSLRGGADPARGVLWGLAGFVTFALAPALGLPPELPGAAAAGVGARQAWWGAAVVLTGGGLALVLLTGRLTWVLVGCVLVALPHLIGAPQPAEHEALAPEALAREFLSASLVTNFAFWVVLGGLAGFFYRRSRPA